MFFSVCSIVLLENMTQMQQWHPDSLKPTAVRVERARPSLMRFYPPREAPSVPNGVTPSTRPRWAPSALAPPRMTPSLGFSRGPVHLQMAWRIRLDSTVMRNPSRCRLAVATSHHLPSRPLQSLLWQKGQACLWTWGAGPASREDLSLWPPPEGHHGCPMTGTSPHCWRIQLGSSTAAVLA